MLGEYPRPYPGLPGLCLGVQRRILGLYLGADIGEPLTSGVEDEHLDITDRGHGELARLVGEQAVSLDHSLVQAGPAG